MGDKELDKFRKKWLSELQEGEHDSPAAQHDLGEPSKDVDEQNTSPACSVNNNTVKHDLQNNKSNQFDCEIPSDEEIISVTTSSNSNEKSDTNKYGGEFPAFHIANDYLNFSTRNCKYCKVEKYNCKLAVGNRRCKCNLYKTSTDDEHSQKQKEICGKKRKRKPNRESYFTKHFRDFPEAIATDTSHDRENESLVDLLISDIDEITCIPFFDIDLPREIAVHIFKWLSIADLANCCRVNSKWQLLAMDDMIWFNMCETLDVDKGVACVADRQGWNTYVKDYILERRCVQQKWKERCCEVKDLINEEDLVVCAASIHGNRIVASYLDGSIRLWELSTGRCGENLKEKYLHFEDVIFSSCSCLHLSEHLCVAGFENGDVMVWRCNTDLSGLLVFMENFNSGCISMVQGSKDGHHFVVVFGSKFVLIGSCEKNENQWNWNKQLEKELSDKIDKLLLVHTVLCAETVITCTSTQLSVHMCDQDTTMMLDKLTGATFSALDYKNLIVVVGISGFGYSILDGYRIRKYCVKSGKQVGNIVGSQTVIMCVNYADCHDDQVVVGCADCSIRIHEFRNETLLVKIRGIESTITTIQMDKWKVLSGHQNGTVCLWDRSNGAMYWQSRISKHPVHIGKFDEQLLTSVNIPQDKLQARNVLNRHQQASIRVMDFTKDNYTIGVPDACHAEYDDITGYDYNIELIAPYDDVESLRLPAI